jgi:hypothetical protein
MQTIQVHKKLYQPYKKIVVGMDAIILASIIIYTNFSQKLFVLLIFWLGCCSPLFFFFFFLNHYHIAFMCLLDTHVAS